MSNPLAIAATTLTLQYLLQSATNNGMVTLKPLDSARGVGGGQQLNLFLYQTQINPNWSNAEMPRVVKGGAQGLPPLALNLHYLITAYGDNEGESHEVLGRAMRILHDYPVVPPDWISAAVNGKLPDSDLHQQPERLHITPLHLNVDEISKLWSGFSTNYRLSVAYEVSVVLIESQWPRPAPLPVLRQGSEDRGPYSSVGGEVYLDEVRYADHLPAATLGSSVSVLGRNLDSAQPVRFSRVGSDRPLTLSPLPGSTSRELQLQLPKTEDGNADWSAGYYLIRAMQTRTNTQGTPISWESNALAFGLAPQITVHPLSVPAGAAFDLTVTCTPHIKDGQKVALILAGQQITPTQVVPAPDPNHPTTLKFTVPTLTPNAEGYPVRLRVDDLDSLPMTIQDGTLQFDPNQKVVVT